MRWIWIDKFLEFEVGQRARAVKNLTLAEEHLHDLIPGYPVMPASLIVEGLAQTGGILVGDAKGFQDRVILAKVSKADFHGLALPGDQLIYETVVLDIREQGATVEGKATRSADGQLIAEVELVFAFLRPDQANLDPDASQRNFVFTQNLLGSLNLDQAKKKTASAQASA